MPLLPRLRACVLGLSTEEASFERRGFHIGNGTVRARLETVGRAFISGYNHGLRSGSLEELASALALTDPELRGFACEGAAMSLALIDCITGGATRRWRRL